MKKNAIILAAGKSNRFAPFTYEKPKGLFSVRGQILMERQIEQLREAGVTEIYVVVGYMKEKFFYLEQKYPGLHLIINNEFGRKGNLYSLYMAREHLKNTFICCADHYFVHNPFLTSEEEDEQNRSYRACIYIPEKFREFAVTCSDAGVITGFHVGGEHSMAMVGQAYVNEKFSARLRELMEAEINDFRVDAMFWEEFYARHQNELTLYMKRYDADEIREFDSIEGLRQFDSEFLTNVDSEIITNICATLHCKADDVTNIQVIHAGLTNVSFSFDCNGIKYVYRHPGGSSGNLIDRRSEMFAQMSAKKLGIDKSVIAMDLSGWKISYYVPGSRNCDFEASDQQLETAMEYLHRLHEVPVPEDGSVRVFDDVEEGKRLMQIASATKGNLEREFADLIEKVERLYPVLKEEAAKLGDRPVLCHNDVYAPNYLYDNQGEIYLIDWEYAGINYGASDIACLCCRYDWTDAQIQRYLQAYTGHELSEEEQKYYNGFIAIAGFYWFCWGLYKGSVGDDDGFFFLPSYHNLVRFIDPALESYGLTEK